MPISRVRFRTDTTPDSNTGKTTFEYLTDTETGVITNDTLINVEVNQNIKINNEEMTITNIETTNYLGADRVNLTVIRGVNGTEAVAHSDNNPSIFKDDSPTYTPTQNPNIGSDISKTYDGIISQKALGGKTYTFANHESSRRQRKLVYENISESNKNRLVALHNYAKGQKNSFQYSEDGDTWYAVRFVNNKLPVSETAYNVYRVEINIEEQL
jgi:hypothetical protein